MTKAEQAVKAELMEVYSQALDELFAENPDRLAFGELEQEIEKLSEKILPETLARINRAKGIFPPELSDVPENK